MTSGSSNWGALIEVGERGPDERWPVRITMESGSIVDRTVTSLDELDDITSEFRVRSPGVQFRGRSFNEMRNTPGPAQPGWNPSS